jgi:hypothetical protein
MQTAVGEKLAAPAPSAAAASGNTQVASPPDQASAVRTSPQAYVSELGAKLMQTRDVKAFVIDALKHPEKGGALYARMALVQCMSREQVAEEGKAAIDKIVAVESTISAEHLAAIQESQTRCAAFADEEEVMALRAESSRLGASGADKSLNLLFRTGALSRTREERVAARKAIAASGNMALLSEAQVPFLMLPKITMEGGGGVGWIVNGRTYGPEDDSAMLAATWLSTCVEGDYCTLETYRLGKCWSHGKCYASREEFVLQDMLKGDQSKFDLALRVADEIRSRMIQGDTSIFR